MSADIKTSRFMTSLRVALLAASALAVSTLAAGCLSPTLPLPPPDAPDEIRENSDGSWTVGGSCLPGAFVEVVNVRTGHGIVVEDKGRTGSYVVTLKGKRCDPAWVQDELGDGETSAPTEFALQAVSPEMLPEGPCE